MLIEAVSDTESAIILQGSWVYYGRHAKQDTKSSASQPPHQVWLNREAYYHEILGDAWSTFPGWCFNVMNPRNLKSGYKRRIAAGPSFEDYISDALKLRATTQSVWSNRKYFPKPVQRIFNSYAQSYLKKRYTIR